MPNQQQSAEAATAQVGDTLTPLLLGLTPDHLRRLRKIRRQCFTQRTSLASVSLWTLNMALLHWEHTTRQLDAFSTYRETEGFGINDSEKLIHSQLGR